jgi:diguanylate cyclase (GGDEF)-like protein/PAS domain S-box-containing protein
MIGAIMALQPGWLTLGAFLVLLPSLYGLRLRQRLQRTEASLARAKADWTQVLDFVEDAMYLLDFADDPMYLIDLQDNLVRGNRAFYDIVGCSPEQAAGRNIAELFHGEREAKPCPICQARLDLRDAVFLKEADDPWNKFGRALEIVVKIVRDNQGRPIGVLQVMHDLSRQRKAEQALRESEDRFRRLSQSAFEGIAIHDGDRILDVNDALASMLSCERTELIGRNTACLVDDTAHAFLTPVIADHTDAPWEVEIRRNDGSTFTAEVRAREFTYEGKVLRVAAIRDITELKRTKEALFQEKERLMVTLESIGEAVITTDVYGRLQYLNPVAEKLTGWSNEEARGALLSEVFQILDAASGERVPDPVQRCLDEDCIVVSSQDSTLRRRDRQEFAIEHSAAPIRDRAGQVIGVVLAFRDVTEVRRLARQLAYQASHDVLTGLINRREFELRLAQALQSARADGTEHALCYLDLDQFKVVNDTCGHMAGDQLLKQLTVLLRPRLRATDILARLGGDEFGVLLEGCPLAKARDIADGLRQTVREFRFVWQDKTFDVGVSLGVVPITADTIGVAEALSAADAACYVAKDRGRNRVYVYQPDDTALAKHHGEMEWAQRIARAIEAGRLCLYCQPIASLAPCDDLPLHEILVRLIDQRGELVPPMAFIPAAERYNVMAAVDRWVIQEVLRLLSRSDMPRYAFAINISGRSLADDHFLDFVLAEVARFGAPERLCFEITETAAVTNFSQAHAFISALKSRGCRFALDDFGSGISSFAYLKSLPVDFLKIDGGFVRDMAQDPIDFAMVESINQVGHVMGVRTIAEYVESEAVLSKLRSLNVDFAQGFAIAAPIPIEQLFDTSRAALPQH